MTEQICLEGFLAADPLDGYTASPGSVAALLPRGRANALTTTDLATITGLAPREITRRICAERRAGAPILSDPGAGFWLATDGDEVRRCALQLRHRAGEIHATARALERLTGR